MFKPWDDFLERHRGLCGASLCLLAFAVFRGTLANGFVFDDSPLIVENPFILNPHFWKHIFTGDAWAFQGGHSSFFYRPLQFTVYWLIYRLAGANPTPFHLASLALYAASGWLVYRLGRDLLKSETAAATGAALWLVHPLHVEPVAWISALADVGSGFFCLLAFLLFLNAETTGQGKFAKHVLAALAFLPALFFKEMALSFPLLLLAFWFFFSGDAKEGWKERVSHGCVYAAVACGYVLVRHAVLGRLTAMAEPWKVSPKVFAAGVGLLGQHTRLFFMPLPLDAFRSFDLNGSFHSPWAWLTLAVLLAAVGLRRREPKLGFLLVWWGVALLPVLDIRQLSFPQVADRFSYFPSAGLCLALAYLCSVKLASAAPGTKGSLIALAPPAFLFCFWTLGSIQGIPAWRNNDTWTRRTSEQSPNSVVLHLRLAENLLFREGNDAAALREYETAFRLNQASSWPMAGFGYAYNNGLGRIALRQGRTDDAIVFFKDAVRVAPQFTEAYDLLGSTFFTRRDFAQAAGYFQDAVKANPYDLNAHFYLGTCWMKLGKFQEAAEQFHAARIVDPAYAQALFAEAWALESAGDPAAAAKVRSLAESTR